MKDDRPPVTGSRHLLPFERLSPDAFERLCLGLLRKEGFQRVRHLGAAGADGGIDLAALDPQGCPIAVQCKRYESLGPADAEAAVRKLLARPWDPPAERLYLLVSTTVSRDAEERAKAACGGLTLEVWALTELDARVNDHPELLERFFQVGADGSMSARANGGIAAGGDARIEARDHAVIATGHYIRINAPSAREIAEAVRTRCVPPAPPPQFTGREEDLSAITTPLVAGSGVGITVALQGMGGVGKTSLALKAAEILDRHHRDVLPGGVLWSRVGPEPDVLAILDGWAALAGTTVDPARFPTAKTRAPIVRQALARLGRLCVILDDVWATKTARHLVEAVPGDFPRLVTTRSVEVVRALHCKLHRLKALPATEAVFLISRLVGPLGRHRAAAERIAGLVEGLPLAIEIVAGQADDAADLPALASALEGRPRLEVLSLESEDRDESVEACFSLSYSNLEAADQKRFRALGILAEAPFDESFLSAIWGHESLDDLALQRLLVRSLVHREPQTGLLRQHTLLRAYAATLLEQSGELERSADRFITHCQALVDQEDWRQTELFYEQVRSAWARLADGSPRRLATFALAAIPFQRRRGLWEDRRTWLEVVSSRLAEIELHDYSPWIHHEIAKLYYDSGNIREGIRRSEGALAVARAIGDRRTEGVILNDAARAHSDLGNQNDALRCYQAALAIFREVGDRREEGTVLNGIAIAYVAVGRTEEALHRLEQALAAAREVDDRLSAANALNNIAALKSRLGRKSEALRVYEEALISAREAGDRRGEGVTLNNIAVIHHDLGRSSVALPQFEEAIIALKGAGDRWQESATLFNYGRCLEGLERFEEALSALEAGFALAVDLGRPDLETHRTVLARVRAKLDARHA